MAEPRFLLDSSICIYILGGHSAAARLWMEERKPGEMATSAIVLAEVMIGVRSPEATAAAEALFRLIPALPFDQKAARVYATLPFRRGSYDRLIAAHALSLRLPLVTNNERDFSDVPGLKIETWTA